MLFDKTIKDNLGNRHEERKRKKNYDQLKTDNEQDCCCQLR